MKDLALVAGIIVLLFMAGSARNYKEDQVMTFKPELVGDWICTQKGNQSILQLKADGHGTFNESNWRWGTNRLGQFCMSPQDECNVFPFECSAYDLEDGELFLTPKSFPCTRFKKTRTKTSDIQPSR
jgi:hypothetical protein